MSKQWFVLRVQSNREEEVRDSLERNLRAEGLEELMPRLLVPTESVTEIRGGKKRVVQRKLYPAYLIAECEVDERGRVPDDLWFLIHDTAGVGDFIGGSQPTPMAQKDVNRLLGQVEKTHEQPKLKIDYQVGDAVRIKKRPYSDMGMTGQVESIDESTGKVTVIMTLFQRQTSVPFEYWEVEPE
jgi:transcriptional antiterminator NusG